MLSLTNFRHSSEWSEWVIWLIVITCSISFASSSSNTWNIFILLFITIFFIGLNGMIFADRDHLSNPICLFNLQKNGRYLEFPRSTLRVIARWKMWCILSLMKRRRNGNRWRLTRFSGYFFKEYRYNYVLIESKNYERLQSLNRGQ